MQDYIKIYEKWISSPKLDEKSKKELEDIKNDEKEIQDRFYQDEY